MEKKKHKFKTLTVKPEVNALIEEIRKLPDNAGRTKAYICDLVIRAGYEVLKAKGKK